MADALCDTSFLMHLATRRIHNIDSIHEEIGRITFVVPTVVLVELMALLGSRRTGGLARRTLEYIQDYRTVELGGRYADGALAAHAAEHRSIIATMDRGLKRRVREAGGSVLSFSGDRIVLDSPRKA